MIRHTLVLAALTVPLLATIPATSAACTTDDGATGFGLNAAVVPDAVFDAMPFYGESPQRYLGGDLYYYYGSDGIFYKESNGEPGLQTGCANSDTYVL
ncbi:MAG: hypothetical protein ACPGQL_03200 [Thermoplasmatota archaeon]